jgi:cobalt-zinc-cadmium efflux system protein
MHRLRAAFSIRGVASSTAVSHRPGIMGSAHTHAHPHTHAHGHGHAHGHVHGHATRSENQKRLAIVLGLIIAYMVAELIGGILTNSLALLADAGHMLSDAVALALALFAAWIVRRPPTSRRTYGYYRMEILAALANGSALVAISVFIFIEAFRRIGHPPEVASGPMMVVAAGGLVVNLAGLWVLHGGRSDSLNIRGAWLHVLTDALGSVAVLVAGALIWMLGWYWADPVASLALGVLVIYSSWALLKETVAVLMEEAPAHIDVDDVRNRLMAMPGVIGVTDLHVWTITSGMVSLSAHIAAADEQPPRTMLADIRGMLHERFGIDHLTIQLEPEGFVKGPSWCDPTPGHQCS